MIRNMLFGHSGSSWHALHPLHRLTRLTVTVVKVWTSGERWRDYRAEWVDQDVGLNTVLQRRR